MGALAEHLPKSCFSLADGGPTFLGRIAAMYSSQAIPVTVVCGYSAPAVRHLLDPYENVTTLDIGPFNPLHGSLDTLKFAISERPSLLDGQVDLVVQDADLLYAASTFQRVIKANLGMSIVAVSTRTSEDDEEVVAYGDAETVTWLGKGAPPNFASTSSSLLGECMGIVRVVPSDHQVALDALRSPGNDQPHSCNPTNEWEEWQRVFARRARLKPLVIDDSFFMEVDTPADYLEARRTYRELILSERYDAGGPDAGRPL